jgi:hypothetical protein
MIVGSPASQSSASDNGRMCSINQDRPYCMSAPSGSDSVASASSPAPTPPNVASTHERVVTP